MKAKSSHIDAKHYRLIEEALRLMAANHQQQPALEEIASAIGLSEHYFQKLFTRWVGLSPKRFSQFLSKEYIKGLLDQGQSPLDACYQAGLSSPSRMHELLVKTEAVTPAQYRALGKSLKIHYGRHCSPFGECLLAVTDRGVCHLSFVEQDWQDNLAQLKAQWQLAALTEDAKLTGTFRDRIFDPWRKPSAPLSLLLKGTNFQIQVWQALLQIPYGAVVPYQDVAAGIGRPAATRAAATAIAGNAIAYLIPCHRVVRKIGLSGEYRWGRRRKRIMLAYEGAMLAR